MTIVDASIRDTEIDDRLGLGYGIEAYLGARVVLDGATLDGNGEYGILVAGEGTLATLSRTCIGHTSPGRSDLGVGLQVQQQALGTVVDSEFSDNIGYGASARTGGMLRLQSSKCSRNVFGGVASGGEGASLAMVGGEIVVTVGVELDGTGVGALAFDGGALSLHDVSLARNS